MLLFFPSFDDFAKSMSEGKKQPTFVRSQLERQREREKEGKLDGKTNANIEFRLIFYMQDMPRTEWEKQPTNGVHINFFIHCWFCCCNDFFSGVQWTENWTCTHCIHRPIHSWLHLLATHTHTLIHLYVCVSVCVKCNACLSVFHR